MGPRPSGKELCEKFFIPLDEDRKQYVCLLCFPAWSPSSDVKPRSYAAGRGYSFAAQHIRCVHPNYEEFPQCNQGVLITPRASNTHDWIEWVVHDNLELSFVDTARARKYTSGNLKPIRRHTLVARMRLCVKVMQEDISKGLPRRFGLMFDGWSRVSTHFIGVLAVGPEVRHGSILLGFSPFNNETDLSAEEHKRYLVTLLESYGRNLSSVSFLIGDNCSTNRKVSRILGIPMLGCNSHRLNLAVLRYLGMDRNTDDAAKKKCTPVQYARRKLLLKISTLMSNLKTIKGSAYLRNFTNLSAVKANQTRWDGNYRMIDRFQAFSEAIINVAKEGGLFSRKISDMMPSFHELQRIADLHQDLSKFNSVSLALQKQDGDLSLLHVRLMFDQLIMDFGPEFSEFLSAESHVVISPALENAIVKSLKGSNLYTDDVWALKSFELDETPLADHEGTDADSSNYVAAIFQSAQKKQRKETNYVDLSRIPVTSNTVERFFSQAKLTFSDLRGSMLPGTLETIMFLKINKSFFSKFVVQRALTLEGKSGSSVESAE